MTAPDSSLGRPIGRRRRWRRLWVRLRVSPFSIPGVLLLFWSGLMLALSAVADGWIVLLAATPLLFAALMALGCLVLYRRDFYA